MIHTDPVLWLQILLLAALIALSGLFSGSEVALIGLGRLRKRTLVEEGRRGAGSVERLLEHPDRLLITILIGNNLVNVASAAIATSLAIDLFGRAGVGIATGIMTVAILLFGEITPKAYASQNRASMSLRVGPVLEALQKVLYPIVWALSKMTRAMNKRFGTREAESTRMFSSEEEVSHAVQLATEEGLIEEDEHEMITSVLELEETPVKHVMLPWNDVVTLDSDLRLASAMDPIHASGYSRLPVVDADGDVVGILYVKDLMPYLETGQMGVTVGEVARDAHFVPETKRLDELLEAMQRERVHMAIVADEHGKTAGIVTMEDLLEEIVGEIHDEYDLGAEPIRWVDDATAIVDARMPIEDVNEELALELPFEEEYDTLGGFVTAKVGRFARVGDVVEHDGVEFVVEKADSRRVRRVRVDGIREPDAEPGGR